MGQVLFGAIKQNNNMKQNSYQKLKQRNAELLKDIEILVMSDDYLELDALKFKWCLHFQSRDAINFGNAGTKGNGIISQQKNNNNEKRN